MNPRIPLLISKTNHTAILFFSRTEKEEAVHKQFLPSKNKKANKKIAACLVKNSLNVVEKTNITYFYIDSNHQYGSTFGEKLSNAIQSIFNKGFNNVISIGNDCPNLSEKDILKAANNLEKGITTIGPTVDGGIYLLGINEKSFCFDKFKNLNWQTNTLVSELKNYFSTQSKTFISLDKKGDIDSFTDLNTYLNHDSNSQFSIAIKEIINTLLTQFQLHFNQVSTRKPNAFLFGLRAPPLAA